MFSDKKYLSDILGEVNGMPSYINLRIEFKQTNLNKYRIIFSETSKSNTTNIGNHNFPIACKNCAHFPSTLGLKGTSLNR